jgi:hypothetical protein
MLLLTEPQTSSHALANQTYGVAMLLLTEPDGEKKKKR